MASSEQKSLSALAFASIAAALLVGPAGGSSRLAPASAAGPEAAAACIPAEVRPVAEPEEALPADPGQRRLAHYLARRFTVAGEATQQMVHAAYRAAREVGLDPLLVLAVIAVESRFNPIAESAMGAKGLMQIIPRYHLDKFGALGGEAAVLDPEANIHVGTRILQEYVYRTGTLEAGLQFYNGAMSDATGQYAGKVMAERGRLEQVLRAPAQRAAATHQHS